jgi:hypothetical protein
VSDVDLHAFEVEIPGGGELMLHSEKEVERWEQQAKSYIEDYQLTKVNDLSIVGMILMQQIEVFRAQMLANGMRAKFHPDEHYPMGEYERVALSPADRRDATQTMLKAGAEITRLEVALGIDKKTRDAGGKGELQDYLVIAKRAAHEYGVHIVERVKFVEGAIMDLSMKLRVLDNADAEDRAYHGITSESILNDLRKTIATMHDRDKEWAADKGVLFRGKL